MNPFFFGDSASPLYGVYHPPTASPKKDEGILLCAPFGQEYMRSHRAFRQLALLLNKRGYPVLRFDYKGTGDSSGEPDDASIKRWIDDILLATEELKHSAQVEKVSLVGLRLGGLLATSASTKLDAVESLILWDCIVSGKRYIDELKSEIEKSPLSKSKCIDSLGNLHFNGFPLLKGQLDELQAIDLTQCHPKAKRVVQICSSESENQTSLKSSWSGYEQYQYELVPAPGDWNFVDDFGGILLPQQIIQAIVACFR